MKKKIIISSAVLIIIAIVVVIVVVMHNRTQNHTPKVNKTELSTIKKNIHIEIKRYEMDLFSLDVNNLAPGLEKLSKKYPSVFIPEGVWKNPQMIKQLQVFLQDPIIQDIYKNVMTVYPNLDDITSEIEESLSYYKYYFPNATIPEFYSLVPGIDFMSPSVYAIEDSLFINLDMYLGQKNKYYNNSGMPLFISERCDKKFIAIDCFKKALVYKHLPKQNPVSLLDNIVYEGKKLYFTELLFPDKPSEDIIGYKQEKFTWAENNQAEVWNYIIQKNLLFSTEEKNITNYVGEMPFTKPFSNKSPGRMGAYIGWQIIRYYVKSHPEVSLESLMQNTDSQDILNKSGFKPTKR